MARHILLDTNALIALSDPAHKLFRLAESKIREGANASTCSIAWHEYMRGPLLNEDRERALRVVQSRILPLERKDAETAARLYNMTGRKRGSTADCLIAAVAMNHDTDLLTGNIEDFRPFLAMGLQLIS